MTRDDSSNLPLSAFHWGTYRVKVEGDRVSGLIPFEHDEDPSPIGHGITDVIDGPTRITAPMIRKSWLEDGPGAHTDRRGAEPFVEVSWETAERLVAKELTRVCAEYGNESIYGGSYGWASAGRFHHAQSHVHRFLNAIGGYTRSVNTYSLAAAEVILPHVLGGITDFIYFPTPWRTIAQHTDLMVAFGGLPVKNGQIGQGGVGRHHQRALMNEAASAGVKFVNVSPLRADTISALNAEWLPCRPSTDTALMLGLAYEVVARDLHDPEFLERCTVGFDEFESYLMGQSDGIPKTADWASEICGVAAGDIRDLAIRMAQNRTMISVSWSLTRQAHGEHTYWAAIALASLLGQIGLPGGGIGFGYTAEHCIGNDFDSIPAAALPQGRRGVNSSIPVARVADMLLEPGTQFDFNGKRQTYPDIRVVYWAGGNPFHHHQDLNRLLAAWRKPDTIIVNDWCWNANARHADIVLPCTTPLERRDVAVTKLDPVVVAMEQAVQPVGQSRNDYDIFAGIAREMGVEDVYTEGRTADEWIAFLYEKTRKRSADKGIDLPPLATLEEQGWYEIERRDDERVMLETFREDPDASPLGTPSGRIELFSEQIASFEYDDCPGHPTWLEPPEWLGRTESAYPLHLISNQPTGKLHSQLDHGSTSREQKVHGREQVALHPDDAAARGIAHHEIVRVFNDRGSCLATACIDDRLMPQVIQLSTGAWFDPVEPGTIGSMCKHGNPNVLTLDKGTSRLAQGPTAHSCLVDVERFEDELPAVTAFEPPEIIRE